MNIALKKWVAGCICVCLAIMLGSWGNSGHSMISFRIQLNFNEEMELFEDWIFYLSEHASDADWRKKDDPEEGPKHYIDIDNYTSFKENGTIPHSLQECIASYGAEFVDDNGYLPWATLASYDSVVHALKLGKWNEAKVFAADLGHYVADGHMPLHLSRNYDGQYTGNKGIHARYEIGLIDRYQHRISYGGSPAVAIENVMEYVFSYIYQNYRYVDSLIIADDYAREMGNGIGTDTYYIALWERTANLTNRLFENASHAFAELLYTAWIEAGRPQEGTVQNNNANLKHPKSGIYPNPVKDIASIMLPFALSNDYQARVFDMSGRETSINLQQENHSKQTKFTWDTSQLSGGAYYLRIADHQKVDTFPFLVSH